MQVGIVMLGILWETVRLQVHYVDRNPRELIVHAGISVCPGNKWMICVSGINFSLKSDQIFIVLIKLKQSAFSFFCVSSV